MKIRRVRIENVRSFLDPVEFFIDGNLSIIIGPNGGGKTNLLDIISQTVRRHLQKSWLSVRAPIAGNPDRVEFQYNSNYDHQPLEKHSAGVARNQIIELEVEVSRSDSENISKMITDASKIQEFSITRYAGGAGNYAQNWNIVPLPGQRFTYTILNNNLQPHADELATQFAHYLERYEIDKHLRQDMGEAALSTPLILLPVSRGQQGFDTTVSLAGYNEADYQRTVESASSRQPGGIIMLAVGRMSKKYRLLEHDNSGSVKERFSADPQVMALTAGLQEMGYSWELHTADPLNNSYVIKLTKNGSTFQAGHASSGEKELLTYLFAIYALNVRDALILIDEPELHLHPRWQRILLNMYARLAEETGNQFIMATHSPVFVSPSSIQHVSRVYNRDQKSHIQRLRLGHLPAVKHLFSIVNSQNNEKIFFADKVILVEGISDRLFFEAVFKRLGLFAGEVNTVELVSVGGKSYFEHYTRLLAACDIPYAIIADLDYVEQIGNNAVKQLFAIDAGQLAEIATAPAYTDHQALVARLGEAISSGNMEDLNNIWEYLKTRSLGLRDDLDDAERAVLDMFIQERRNEGVCILSKGALEKYLPSGRRSKDVERLITFLQTDFWNALEEDSRNELTAIVNSLRM